MKEHPLPTEWKVHRRWNWSARYEEEEESFLGCQSKHDSPDFHPVAQSLYQLRNTGSKIKVIW
jgi:hypothetical protein